MSDYKTMLVATDCSDGAEMAMSTAADLAKRLGSRVLLVYAVEDRMPPLIDSETRRLALEEHEKLAKSTIGDYARKRFGALEREELVEVGRPDEVILKLAKSYGADLVVVGSHGYGTLGKMLIGSTADRVLRRAPCPVLVVRGATSQGGEP